MWVRFWILKPDGAGPFPLALTPHGHENGDEYAGVWDTVRTREKIERTNQDVAVQAAKRGFLAIAPATRGMGANPSSYRIRDILPIVSVATADATHYRSLLPGAR